MSDVTTVSAGISTAAIADDNASRIAMASDIVAAYVTHNSLPSSELPAFIASIYYGLGAVGEPATPAEEPRAAPAVPMKKSITPDYLICLEDGKKFKTLKRHLLTTYDMTPEQYRTKWRLPSDYPMTAPAYSEKRSSLAKAAGLGAHRSPGPAQKIAAPAKNASKRRAKKAA